MFELADQDPVIAGRFLAKIKAPTDFAKAQLFAAESSERVALAARIVIEQSDLIVAVWDGNTTLYAGGTGHTIATALDLGAPVIWIDANAPEAWRILRAPESLVTLGAPTLAEASTARSRRWCSTSCARNARRRAAAATTR